MRAVFTGTTGFGKQDIAEAVAREAAKAAARSEDLTHQDTRSHIQVFSVEEEIKNQTLGDLRPFLDQILHRERIRQWGIAMEKILSHASNSQHCILCFHNVFYRRSNFFTCIVRDLLAAYQPTVFVTLINDVYDVWETINARERELATNSYLSLPEIMAWRSAEFAATENLSQSLYVSPHRHGISTQQIHDLKTNYPTVFGNPIPHFIFAVKHPAQTLYRLLFRRDLLLTYAAFPITALRKNPDPSGRDEIDTYRQQLFETGFLTVFDPLTIDEFRFTDPPTPGKIPLSPRWPTTIGLPMVEEIPLTTNPFESFGDLESEAFKESVGSHIEGRDFQLVSQAQVLAAYRPWYGGPLGSGAPPSDKPSAGVDKEIGYALTESKHIYAVHPDQDRTGGLRVFQNINFAVHPKTTPQLLDDLKKVQQQWDELRKNQGIPLTWESA